MDITNLVKLREQPCWQIDTGEIRLGVATMIFQRKRSCIVGGLERKDSFILVGRIGFEPMTIGLKARCSTS